ncbi:MAG: penicillin-binding transpeptidase domain-containing protein, partial [Phycisphaerales bacterium]
RMSASLEATEALMRSCNIFFFTLGQKLGPERITEWFGRFGVGDGAGIKHPDLGVGPQFEGRAEPMATKKDGEWVRRGVTPSESIMMGIGQGPIAWTPLHAADAYATIARRGVRILPRMRIDDPAAGEDLRLNQRAVTLGLRGLERSVGEEGGTGYHIVVDDDDGVKRNEKVFNVPGVHVWGKSGTADSGHRVIDPVTGRDLVDEHGNKITLDHAWFVVLAGDRQDDRPKYAVALVVENGGSGGKVSGPICNQVLRALVEEGYLSSGVTPQDAGGAAP